MLILHGENIVQSRDALVKAITQAKHSGTQIVRIEAKTLEVPHLERLFAEQSLFGDTQLVIIEELHSLPKSQRKDQLIEFVVQCPHDLILWEKRQLTATMLKKFPGAGNQEFKVSNSVFKWLDSLSGSKDTSKKKMMIDGLRAAIQSDGEFMCHAMLARQVRMLIQMQEGSLTGLAPFMLSKLQKQAASFLPAQLLLIHHRLLEIDIAEKTSTGVLSFAQQLELLLAEM